MIIRHGVDLVEHESFARLVAREEARELILVAGILRGVQEKLLRLTQV
jgi:hypothetical protein